MRTALPLLAALLAAPLAHARPADAAPADEPRWTLGLIAIERDAPYRQLDEDLLVVPLVRFEGERAYLRGLRGGFRLVERGPLELSAFVQARGDGYEAADSPYLAGMDDRRFSLDAGMALGWRVPRVGQFEVSVATDVLDRSGGQELEASWTGLVRAGQWRFLPSVALRWQSSDLVDYYYGVRPGEALPGRPAYEGDAALLPELSVLATRRLGERWQLFARIGHTWLPGEITDSPLVDDDRRTSVIVGLGYALGD
ncbi:MipA/OmpV family protein [Arenimonas caeni]|jgi:outer membrane protein|uniref:MipA/OmpV family protein n=1 Tax=Arenimonas caeni TaxID=2058085 RepID=UPI002A35CFFF|nr:MipA/OmpV family protein [Arenimonas caeni]MDY0021740.1 MipA/OmpV family protein [Arenimonas caeni]